MIVRNVLIISGESESHQKSGTSTGRCARFILCGWRCHTLTEICTQSSPTNLGMYLSPRATSDLLSGLKRHTTLILHSAGSAISAAQWGWIRDGSGMDAALRAPAAVTLREAAAAATGRPRPSHTHTHWLNLTVCGLDTLLDPVVSVHSIKKTSKILTLN